MQRNKTSNKLLRNYATNYNNDKQPKQEVQFNRRLIIRMNILKNK